MLIPWVVAERAMFDVIGSGGMVFIVICLVSPTIVTQPSHLAAQRNLQMKNLYRKGRCSISVCHFKNAMEERHANNRNTISAILLLVILFREKNSRLF